MKYAIEIEASDLVYIGNLLDKQPYGEVAKIVTSIQPQITAQDTAEKMRAEAVWHETMQSWVQDERRRRNAEAEQPAKPEPIEEN